ncbi:hypothetical protein ACFJGW_01095 [Burkholderiaceae bacterium UC74_6]
MLIFRLVFGLLIVAGLVCLALYIATRQPVWRQRAVIILKWTVIAILAIFGVLIIERVPMLL